MNADGAALMFFFLFKQKEEKALSVHWQYFYARGLLRQKASTSNQLLRDTFINEVQKACDENTAEYCGTLKSWNQEEKKNAMYYIYTTQVLKTEYDRIHRGTGWSAAKAILTSHQGMQTQFAPRVRNISHCRHKDETFKVAAALPPTQFPFRCSSPGP